MIQKYHDVLAQRSGFAKSLKLPKRPTTGGGKYYYNNQFNQQALPRLISRAC